MNLLLCSATPLELEPTLGWLRERAEATERNVLRFGRVSLEVLFTGVGPTATAFALGHRFGGAGLPQLAIQAGVAGAFDRELRLGEVVRVTSERFGDLGAEDRDGTLLRLTDIGLPPGPPFDGAGVLTAPDPVASLPFPPAAGLTVNRTSGSAATIAKLRHSFPDAQVETMEGAAFFYACLQAGVEPLQLRAVSNYVTPRDRSAWRMAEAIQGLDAALRQLLGAFLGEAGAE